MKLDLFLRNILRSRVDMTNVNPKWVFFMIFFLPKNWLPQKYLRDNPPWRREALSNEKRQIWNVENKIFSLQPIVWTLCHIFSDTTFLSIIRDIFEQIFFPGILLHALVNMGCCPTTDASFYAFIFMLFIGRSLSVIIGLWFR